MIDPIRDPIRHHLAVLCGEKLKESFPEVKYKIDAEHHGTIDGMRETVLPLSITLRNQPRYYWLMTVRFFKDRAMISSTQPPGSGGEEREVSYNDPKFIDILLSELETQIEIA